MRKKRHHRDPKHKKSFNFSKLFKLLKKKGLSAVVTTLIIILLVMVAIAIVWVVISNVISQGAEEVSLGKFTVDAEISNVNIDNSTNNVSLSVKRKVGDGNISGIKFIFYTNTGSEIVEEEISIQELETRKFNFHLNTDVNQIIRISIVPLFKTKEGKKINGNIIATRNVGGGSSGGSSGSSCTPDCTGRECGSDGCGGTCGSCGGGEYCSSGTCLTGTNPCDLTTAFWSDSEVVEGTLVTLNVTGTDCEGTDINFTIYEDDPLFDDYVESIVDTFDSTNWISFWTYSGDDDVGTDPRDYYFIAIVLDNPSESVTSSDLSVSQLPTEYCGNNIIDGSDVCDGTDLGSETCVTQGYSSGTLSCLSDCTGFNFTSCVNDTCTPDCSCASTTCTGSTCDDGCGSPCTGTLAPDCGTRECGAAPNGCGTANECGSCSGSESCISGTCVTAMTCNSISQYGITWTFDTNYLCGQFVNGDWWVVGPVNIIDIFPKPGMSGSSQVENGSMINPIPDSGQGYAGTYLFDISLTVGLGVSGSSPVSLGTGQSIISTIYDPISSQYLKTAAVLTCLSSIPPENSFRPAYSDPSKTLYSANSLNTGLLASLPFSNSYYTLAEIESRFERVWLEHQPTWLLHPIDNMEGYGREIARDIGIGALMLNLNYTLADKQTLLIEYTQLGIDLYYVAINGGDDVWYPDGGHKQGRKWPIVFAGLMLGDQGMINIGDGSLGFDDNDSTIQFQEDAQTWYVDDYAVNVMQPYDGVNYDTLHYQAPYNGVEYGGYVSGDIGLPEWGGQHSDDPWGRTVDSRNWSISYRGANGISWRGFVLAALIMDAKDFWDHDVLFDYTDRYHFVTGSGGPYENYFASNDAFTYDVWETYRSAFGCVWTPDNIPDSYSQGHYDCDGQLVRCDWQQSTIGSLVTSCGGYPNQRAIDYDPCNVC